MTGPRCGWAGDCGALRSCLVPSKSSLAAAVRPWVVAVALVAALIALAGCEAHKAAVSASSCGTSDAGGPASGALLGVSLDWSQDSIEDYTNRLGHAPAV